MGYVASPDNPLVAQGVADIGRSWEVLGLPHNLRMDSLRSTEHHDSESMTMPCSYVRQLHCHEST